MLDMDIHEEQDVDLKQESHVWSHGSSRRSMPGRFISFKQRMQLSNLGKDLEGFRLVILLLVARQGCHCINLYCLMEEACSLVL
ncbi:hypothetical protein K492DRAFT_62764 [Lichtheimia hyalospora FSU 10163]|nr:hypothetical protein K492DRAFT_62764 [Lichtheimia hyalospora FSU 10163]